MNAIAVVLVVASSTVSRGARVGTRDSARVVDGRVLVEPLGISVTVPALWFGGPRPSYDRDTLTCANRPSGTVRDRVVVEPDRLPALRGGVGEWRRE